MTSKILRCVSVFVLFANACVLNNYVIEKTYCSDTLANIVVYRKFVSAVGEYINKFAPNSKINPATYVDASLTYNVNIGLMLAQGLHESHFGTQGRAKNTKNIYNLGNDDVGNNRYFKTYDEGVFEYAKVLRDRYLGEKRTTDDLLKNFVCLRGYRYASNEKYEQILSKTIKTISSETCIITYYDFLIKTDLQCYQQRNFY